MASTSPFSLIANERPWPTYCSTLKMLVTGRAAVLPSEI